MHAITRTIQNFKKNGKNVSQKPEIFFSHALWKSVKALYYIGVLLGGLADQFFKHASKIGCSLMSKSV